MKILIASLTLLCVSVTSIYPSEVSLAPNCFPTLLPAVLDQAFGFDLTLFNHKGPDPKGYGGQRGQTKPILRFTCRDPDNPLNQYGNLTTPDQLDTYVLPSSTSSSSSQCFDDTSTLISDLRSRVVQWEKFPYGSFEIHSSQRLSESAGLPYTLPTSARCLVQVSLESNKFSTRLSSLHRYDRAHPYLDLDFVEAYNRLPLSLDTVNETMVYTDFINNYGTSYWKTGFYGNGLHVYVLTAKAMDIGVQVVKDGIDAWDKGLRGNNPQMGDLIKKSVDAEFGTISEVYVRKSTPGFYSKQSVNIMNGVHTTIDSLFERNAARTRLLKKAIADHLSKAWFHLDLNGEWRYDD